MNKSKKRKIKGGFVDVITNLLNNKDVPAPAGQPPAGQPPAGQPPALQPPAPAGQPPASQINVELQGNIAEVARTVIDSILTSTNIELEKKYADFINKNGTYKPGRDLNTVELVRQVQEIMTDLANKQGERTAKIAELTKLKVEIEKNLNDIEEILNNSGDIDLNDSEKVKISKEQDDLTKKLDEIDKQLEILQKEEKKIEEGEEIKKVAEQKFKINFKIGLKTSDTAQNIYYNTPTITITSVDENNINTITDYTKFTTLQELSTSFNTKFKELQKVKSDQNFRDALHVFKSKYVKFTGGSNYGLIIDFDIYIFLKNENGQVIVDTFYFNINENAVQNITDSSNLDNTDVKYPTMKNTSVLPKNGILTYILNVNGLDPGIQQNIKTYLDTLGKYPVAAQAAAVGGGRSNNRTKKNKRNNKIRTIKRKYSKKRKSKIKKKN